MHVLKIVVSTNKSKFTFFELSKKLIVQIFKIKFEHMSFIL